MITVCALYVVRGEWHEQQATEEAWEEEAERKVKKT